MLVLWSAAARKGLDSKGAWSAPAGKLTYLNREGAGWFGDVSSWSSNFLVLGLYLLDADGKENTENAAFATN